MLIIALLFEELGFVGWWGSPSVVLDIFSLWHNNNDYRYKMDLKDCLDFCRAVHGHKVVPKIK